MATNLEVNNLAKWPLWFQLFLMSLIAAAVIFIGNLVYNDDVKLAVGSKEKKLQTTKTNFAKLQKEVADLDAIRHETEALELVLTDLLRYLPNDVEMPSLIDAVYKSARENSIVFEQLTPEKDIQEEHYTIKPIALKAETGYKTMASFIQKVTSLDRIMNIDSVSFKRSRSSQNVDKDNINIEDLPLGMSAELRTYIFKGDKVTNSRGKP